MKVRVDIDTSTFVRFWLVVIGFIAAIYMLFLAKTALTIIGAALFLAIALNYPVNWLSSKLPGKSRIAATSVAFVVVVAFIGMVVFMVIPPIAEQTSKLVSAVPRMVSQASAEWSTLGDLIDRYHIQPQVDAAIKSIQERSTTWLTSIGGNVVTSLTSLFSSAAAAILMLVMSFLMLIEGPLWLKKIWTLYKNKERMRHHRHILSRMNNAVSGYVTGQLSVSGIGAIMAGLIVFLVSLFIPEVPKNLTLPTVAIMFLLSLIPMFGTTIASVIIAALLALNSVTAAVAFLIAFFTYQQIENNVIYPTVQSRFVEMSPLVILVAVTLGLYLFGLAGGVISIPVAGVIKVLIEELILKETSSTYQKKPTTKKKGTLIAKIKDAS